MKSISTIEELEDLEIFSHLEETVARPAANQDLFQVLDLFASPYTSGEMELNHTNGASTLMVGTDIFINSAIGGGLSGGANPQLVATPGFEYWKSCTIPARAKKITIKTNVKAGDCIDDFNPDSIVAWFSQLYRTGANSATSGQRDTLYLGETTGYGDDGFVFTALPSGPSNTPAEIGDIGTFVLEQDIINPGNVSRNIGNDGEFPPYYFIFAAQVPASAETKVYKIKFELEYE